MKAIIIEEARFTEFCEMLDGQAAKLKERPDRLEMISVETLRKLGVPVITDGRDNNVISEELYRAVVDEVKRRLHYEFVTWAQIHGASCTTRK